MKKYILLLLIIICTSENAYAQSDCVCRGSLSLQEEIDGSDSIFLAKVRKVMKEGKWENEFVILRAWKGFALRSTYATQMLNQVNTCDYFFENGKVYLVFSDAVSYKNELTVSRCSRTKEAREALGELSVLGPAEADHTSEIKE